MASRLIQKGAGRALQKADDDDPAIAAAVVPPPAQPVRRPQQPATAREELPVPVETDAEGPLDADETRLLVQCEAEISGLQTAMVRTGKALHNIRDRKLWRGRYETWADYLADRWDGMGTSQAHRLIQAWPYGEALERLAGDKLRESHVRELVPVGDVTAALAIYRALVEHTKGRARLTAPVVAGTVKAYRALVEQTQTGSVVETTAVQAVKAYLESLGEPEPEPAPADPAQAWQQLQEKVLKPVTSASFRKAAKSDPKRAREVLGALRRELDALFAALPE